MADLSDTGITGRSVDDFFNLGVSWNDFASSGNRNVKFCGTGVSRPTFIYTGDGTFTVTETITAEVLIVAHGGPGGKMSGDSTWVGGGGGGGGVIHQVGRVIAPGNYPIVVTGYVNSSFNGLVALRGGGGGGYWIGSNWPGEDGGSGGGGQSGSPWTWFTGYAGAGEPGQGYAGAPGSGKVTYTYPPSAYSGLGGGGGGASAPGSGKNGGQGYACSISGSLVVYGSGGAGADVVGNMAYSAGSPGTNAGAPKQNGVNGTGGGGGAALYEGAPTSPGVGGTGIVIIRL